MKRVVLALALGAAVAFGTPAARAAAPTPVPDMRPNLSSMSFMLGTWSCHSMTRGSYRPDTTSYTMDYDGRWIKGHDLAPPFDKFRKRTIVTDTWITYNDVLHQWVQTSVDNFGGYSVVTSPGWSGNRITWTSSVTPDGSTGSDTLTKVSDTQTRDVATGRDRNGKPQPVTTTICTKH
jgi:hypothetical protein